MVSAGSDHDLKNIYCSQLTKNQENKTVCNFRVKNAFTKQVQKIHIHPKFQFKFLTAGPSNTSEASLANDAFDIALVEIDPFDLSDESNILPGCLYESNAYDFGEQLLAAGLF